MKRFVIAAQALFFAALLVSFAPAALASDHADPIFLSDPEANITGLFCFPHGDQLVLILNVRRSTTKGTPFPLAPYEYDINIDTHSEVTYDDENRARYGGKVTNPEGISADINIKIHLNDDITFKDVAYTGLKDTKGITTWSGLRDDPFIFPRFFKVNVISLVFSIPQSALPPGRQDFLLWGVTSKNGKEIDHVGRSNRTQLGRFYFINTLPPNQHVAAIMKEMKKTDAITKWLKKYDLTTPLGNGYSMLLGIRKYDLAPDVMVYTTRYPPGFPNGRQLTDDIVAKTCETGDCDLQELSFTEGNWPRAVINDKPFSPNLPFEADPWPVKTPEKALPVSFFWHVGIWLLLIVLLIAALYTWIVYRIGKKAGLKQRRLA
jgi:hypothetical protein